MSHKLQSWYHASAFTPLICSSSRHIYNGMEILASAILVRHQGQVVTYRRIASSSCLSLSIDSSYVSNVPPASPQASKDVCPGFCVVDDEVPVGV